MLGVWHQAVHWAHHVVCEQASTAKVLSIPHSPPPPFTVEYVAENGTRGTEHYYGTVSAVTIAVLPGVDGQLEPDVPHSHVTTASSCGNPILFRVSGHSGKQSCSVTRRPCGESGHGGT